MIALRSSEELGIRSEEWNVFESEELRKMDKRDNKSFAQQNIQSLLTPHSSLLTIEQGATPCSI